MIRELLPARTLEKELETLLPPIRRVKILHSYFDAITLSEAADWSIDQVLLGKQSYICTVNVAILMLIRAHLGLRSVIDRAGLTVADGQPIVWLSHWLGNPLPERVTGIDLIDAIAKRAEQENIGVYLLGATPEIIERSAQRIQQKYPRLQLDYNDGYFPLEELEHRIELINRSGAKILLVGMGVPIQEFFLERSMSELNVNLAMGVGGSFDVLSGSKQRAPGWMQRSGLEWFYRLIQEPRRLGKRYFTTNLLFIFDTVRFFCRRWLKQISRTIQNN